MKSKKCILCDRDNSGIFVQHENFEILRCRNCGLYYQYTPQSFESLEAIYNNIYDENPHALANKKYYFMRAKTQYDDIVMFRNKKGRVLEIGCSYGTLMEFFIKNNWEATGIDISENAIRYARLKGLDCHKATPEQFKSEHKFDVVILSNVLEHLENPLHSLEIIKNWLTESGFIYIRVPNSESVVLPSRRQSFLGDMKSFEHLFYFSKNNLKVLIEKAGLKSFIKTDGTVNIGDTLNCFFRSKIVLKSPWQELNFRTKTEQKKRYLLLKHIYGEILTVLSFIPIGPKNREIVAFASNQEVKLTQ